ncbi:ABC-2 type transport system ATP-binding protein [Panacagrimonas perspica]|uniref:ABC-2 type transport system ATP-binding protein n=1 Tax=Panacagrimonas perspica TaxID=381431 RepID=A0A4S3K2S1_9GAMM|nr:ABC transporter ATP-binding protein [Panacagrimonas perspica]TDU28854.1 ABC-2 type transport system ATP-binding protein [Panacagrimonas perspica]THD02315.1 ABC transporter ATP-binding protein [Panacagrimonas perspica]
MASDNILIEARGLTRRFGPNVAVADLSLKLAQGEILGLLGPNGAGKSTTMKMLTGNLAPTEGEVFIKGQSLRDDAVLAKQQLGYLPEQPPVYPELTVDEYLRYCAGLHGIASKARAAAVDSAKRDCGLSDVGRRVIGNLSKGFQQRVGLAQAIIHRPPVVVLDEPTVGLDPIQIREIRTLIRELGRVHSVILSSHILPEIQAVCGRVMIVNRGRLVYDAAIDAHLGNPKLIVGFARAPGSNELAEMQGVLSAETLDDRRFRLSLDPAHDPRDAIVALAVQRGWGLQELRLEAKTLEEIFVELTSGDVQPLMRNAA